MDCVAAPTGLVVLIKEFPVLARGGGQPPRGGGQHQRRLRQATASVNFASAFDGIPLPEPKKLCQKNSNQFKLCLCEEKTACGGEDLPTSYRCMVKMKEGEDYITDKTVRICGKPFCLLLTKKRLTS